MYYRNTMNSKRRNESKNMNHPIYQQIVRKCLLVRSNSYNRKDIISSSMIVLLYNYVRVCTAHSVSVRSDVADIAVGSCIGS